MFSAEVKVAFVSGMIKLTVSILVSCSAITLDGNPRMLVASNSEGSGGDVTPLVGSVGDHYINMVKWTISAAMSI